MTPPPIPLVGSGRRPRAGPGRQPGEAHPAGSLVVGGLAATFMLGPALVAVLPMIFAGRLDGGGVQAVPPFQLVPILALGRLLLSALLVANFIRSRELE